MDFSSSFASLTPLDQVETNAIRVIPIGELSNADLARGSSFPREPTPLEEDLLGVEESDSGLCRVCRTINLNPPIYTWVIKSYGTTKQILSRQHCAICRLVLWILAQDMGFLKPAALAHGRPEISCNLQWVLIPNKDICLVVEVENRPRGWIISQNLNSPFVAQRRQILDRCHSRKTEVGILDFRRIRAWINECEHIHSGLCSIGHMDMESSNSDKIMLIDVSRMQLVESLPTSRYIALSYVWGGVSGLQTTKCLLPAFQEEGGLLSYNDQIPSTIKDAIKLVTSLGERFLWVDSLCIVQDDPLHKYTQISQMNIIYGLAFLTIVAVAGETANARLPGVDRDTRLSIPDLETVQGICLVPSHLPLASILDGSVYESRAWTFQERVLSKRCLFLTRWMAYYQCSSFAFTEDEDLFKEVVTCFPLYTPKSNSNFKPESMVWNPLCATNLKSRSRETSPLGWLQGFDVYGSLVKSYTKKRLSYPSDILNAFSGIGKVLEQRYGGWMVYALPEAILDLALLWTPGDITIQRRKFLPSATSQQATLPSWTWAAWEGSVNFTLPQNIIWSSSPKRPSLRIEIGMFSIGSRSDFRPVDRQVGLDFIEHPVCAPHSPEQSHKHEAGEEVLYFWTVATQANEFKVLGQQLYHLQEPMPATRILDQQGRHCGLLLHYEKVVSIEKWTSKHVYEFVVLSTAAFLEPKPGAAVSIRFDINNGIVHEPIFDCRFYRLAEGETGFVNVMLIEWCGDFAERVAIGCIHKEAWANVNSKRRYVRLI